MPNALSEGCDPVTSWRECLAITVDHTIDADGAVAVLDRLAIERGTAPAFVRFDHGREFVAHAVAD